MIAAASTDSPVNSENHPDRRMPSATQPAGADGEPQGSARTVVDGRPRSPARLSRTLINFWLDALLGVLFFLLCVTAVIVQFVFPPGVAARGVSLWGGSYGQWCSLQFALTAALGLGVLVHVMLHWSWVCSVLTRRILRSGKTLDDGIRTIYGVGLMIGLLLCGATVVGLAQWMIVLP